MSEKKNEIAVRSSAAEYLTFITASGESGVEAVYADENVWLSQKMMALLYDVETNTVNYHLKKAYSDQELDEESTIRNFRILRKEGTRNVERDVLHYTPKGRSGTGKVAAKATGTINGTELHALENAIC